MKYRRFLFDLDDTLLDFRASESLSFRSALGAMGIGAGGEALFGDYQRENLRLWSDFEKGLVTKEHLKVERFRRAFALHGIEADPERASLLFLESLPENVVLVDGALELCEALAAFGQIGIITNGVEAIATRRIARSGLAPWLSFVASSDICGFPKPDVRFFEYSASRFDGFDKAEAIIIGDRLDADILGAMRFGIDSCWYNPHGIENRGEAVPTFEVSGLHHIVSRLTEGA